MQLSVGMQDIPKGHRPVVDILPEVMPQTSFEHLWEDILKNNKNLEVFHLYKDCLIIIRTLFLLFLFAVNFHAFNFKLEEV